MIHRDMGLLRRVTAGDLGVAELELWLDGLFHPEQLSDADRIVTSILTYGSTESVTEIVGVMEYARDWLQYVATALPKTDYGRLNYIATAQFTYHNYLGKVLPTLWQHFFDDYPSGQIWVFGLSGWLSDAFENAWTMPDAPGPSKVSRELRLALASAATGLEIEAFPHFALAFLALSIHPLILCDHALIHNGHVLLYVPDRALTYPVMLEGDTANHNLLGKVFDVLDDGRTYGARGPKWRVDAQRYPPAANLGYFEWFVDAVACRMNDLLNISDLASRVQLAWTVNRLCCDAMLCITSEMPYMSKTFFFRFLDKYANLVARWDNIDDTQAWLNVMDRPFLADSVRPIVASIPADVAGYFATLVDDELGQMKYDGLSPIALRAIRNSEHGYFLKERSLGTLVDHSAFSNDLGLLVAPLLLKLLSMPWS